MFYSYSYPVLNSSGQSHVVLLSTNEEQKRELARDVCDTFASHAGLVYDVADTDCGHKMAALLVMFLRLSNISV